MNCSWLKAHGSCLQILKVLFQNFICIFYTSHFFQFKYFKNPGTPMSEQTRCPILKNAKTVFKKLSGIFSGIFQSISVRTKGTEGPYLVGVGKVTKSTKIWLQSVSEPSFAILSQSQTINPPINTPKVQKDQKRKTLKLYVVSFPLYSPVLDPYRTTSKIQFR